MYAMLEVPGRYKPIQSVALGEAIPFQVAVSAPPAEMVVGLAVKVAVAPLVTIKLLLALNWENPLSLNRRST
jgi:hypothetical protein